VPSASAENDFRILPSVDEVLQQEAIARLKARFPRHMVVEAVREVLAALRGKLVDGRRREVENQLPQLPERVRQRLDALISPSLRPVINATGVVLHTNLGRAPLSAAALHAIAGTAGAYNNLEYDLANGARGRRDVHAAALLERLLGAPAIVVNNNAAAIFLALHELASGGEVIVSRGELIEIGEGFRIPDILARSGARLREVGTTNRTRIEDYRAAITGETRAILRVHHSNFRIVGFTDRPSLKELVDAGSQAGIPVVEDLGSGCLVDLKSYGLEHEPTVGESIAAGIDVVTFSGDKLLGGPQAGILAGKKEWIGRLRRNPLFRALRVDKLIYAALSATLRDYLLEDHAGIPIFAMLDQKADQIRERAEKLVAALPGIEAQLHPGSSVIGGGSTPAMELPTTLISLRPPDGASAAACERLLRTGGIPVVARLEKERIILDLRTVLPEQEAPLAGAIRSAWSRYGI